MGIKYYKLINYAKYGIILALLLYLYRWWRLISYIYILLIIIIFLLCQFIKLQLLPISFNIIKNNINYNYDKILCDRYYNIFYRLYIVLNKDSINDWDINEIRFLLNEIYSIYCSLYISFNIYKLKFSNGLIIFYYTLKKFLILFTRIDVKILNNNCNIVNLYILPDLNDYYDVSENGVLSGGRSIDVLHDENNNNGVSDNGVLSSGNNVHTLPNDKNNGASDNGVLSGENNVHTLPDFKNENNNNGASEDGVLSGESSINLLSLFINENKNYITNEMIKEMIIDKSLDINDIIKECKNLYELIKKLKLESEEKNRIISGVNYNFGNIIYLRSLLIYKYKGRNCIINIPSVGVMDKLFIPGDNIIDTCFIPSIEIINDKNKYKIPINNYNIINKNTIQIISMLFGSNIYELLYNNNNFNNIIINNPLIIISNPNSSCYEYNIMNINGINHHINHQRNIFLYNYPSTGDSKGKVSINNMIYTSQQIVKYLINKFGNNIKLGFHGYSIGGMCSIVMAKHLQNLKLQSKSTPPEVQSNSLGLADSSPLEVQSTSSSTRRGASSNYISLKSRATPRDRGGGDGSGDVTSSGVPESDLWELEGKINREADGRTTSGGTASGKESSTGPRVEPAADLREAEGELNREADGRTTSGGTASRKEVVLEGGIEDGGIINIDNATMIGDIDEDNNVLMPRRRFTTNNNIDKILMNEIMGERGDKKHHNTPPEVTTTVGPAYSSPLEVTTTVGLADSSPNYLSLKSRATPGDRGDVNPEEQEMSTPKNENIQPGGTENSTRKNVDNQPLRTGILPVVTGNDNPEEQTSDIVEQTSSGKPESDPRELEGEGNKKAATASGKECMNVTSCRIGVDNSCIELLICNKTFGDLGLLCCYITMDYILYILPIFDLNKSFYNDYIDIKCPKLMIMDINDEIIPLKCSLPYCISSITCINDITKVCNLFIQFKLLIINLINNSLINNDILTINILKNIIKIIGNYLNSTGQPLINLLFININNNNNTSIKNDIYNIKEFFTRLCLWGSLPISCIPKKKFINNINIKHLFNLCYDNNFIGFKSFQHNFMIHLPNKIITLFHFLFNTQSKNKIYQSRNHNYFINWGSIINNNLITYPYQIQYNIPNEVQSTPLEVTTTPLEVTTTPLDVQSNSSSTPPEVTTTSVPLDSTVGLADSSPLEVQSTSSSTRRGASSNYISLKSKATPGDRGEGCDGSSIMGMMEDGSKDVLDVTSSGMKSSTGPQVEPAADLWEAEGEVNRRAVCKTTSGGTPSGRSEGSDWTSGGKRVMNSDVKSFDMLSDDPIPTTMIHSDSIPCSSSYTSIMDAIRSDLRSFDIDDQEITYTQQLSWMRLYSLLHLLKCSQLLNNLAIDTFNSIDLSHMNITNFDNTIKSQNTPNFIGINKVLKYVQEFIDSLIDVVAGERYNLEICPSELMICNFNNPNLIKEINNFIADATKFGNVIPTYHGHNNNDQYDILTLLK